MDIPVSTELTLLGWSVVLLLLHVAVQGGLVAPKRGLTWNAGPRDEGQPPLGICRACSTRARQLQGNLPRVYRACAGTCHHQPDRWDRRTRCMAVVCCARPLFAPLRFRRVADWPRAHAYQAVVTQKRAGANGAATLPSPACGFGLAPESRDHPALLGAILGPVPGLPRSTREGSATRCVRPLRLTPPR